MADLTFNIDDLPVPFKPGQTILEAAKAAGVFVPHLGYEYEMMSPHFVEFFPKREMDASHPDALIDRNRCILCERCVRASRDLDKKSVFGIAGRGGKATLVINSPTGKLVDSAFAITDHAAHICPVGAIIIKRVGFVKPIGERDYDKASISAEVEVCEIPESAS